MIKQRRISNVKTDIALVDLKSEVKDAIIDVTQSSSYTIGDFLEILSKYDVPRPSTQIDSNCIAHIFWEKGRYISKSFSEDGFSHTRVDVKFIENRLDVYVSSDEYLQTRVKDLGKSYTCTFYSVDELTIFILQLKDLGFIQ